MNENELAKNLLLNHTCDNCFFHANPYKLVHIFCMKGNRQPEHYTCEDWITFELINHIPIKDMRVVTQSDAEFLEKKLKEIEEKHNFL